MGGTTKNPQMTTVYGMDISGGLHPIFMLQAMDPAVEFDYKICNLMAGENKQPDFLAINPMHCIPALTDSDSGAEIWECNAVLRFLANKFNHAAYPTDLRLRAECDTMLDHRNTQIVKHMGYGLLYGKVGFGADHTADEEKATMDAIVADTWPAMKKYITKNGGPFMGGAQPNLADLSIFGYAMLLHTVRPNLPIWTECEGLVDWVNAFKGLPAFEAVYTPERIGFWQSKTMEEVALPPPKTVFVKWAGEGQLFYVTCSGAPIGHPRYGELENAAVANDADTVRRLLQNMFVSYGDRQLIDAAQARARDDKIMELEVGNESVCRLAGREMTTIEMLKAYIQDRTGIYPDCQDLQFQGSMGNSLTMEDGRLLADYGVQPDDTIILSLKFRGC